MNNQRIILACAACLVLSPTASTLSAQEPSLRELVGWWQLDEANGASAADSSGNGLHGNVVGEPKWRATGVGGAFEFDGTTYIAVGNESPFDITEAITVAAWVKVTQFDRNFQAIITKGDTSWRIARDRDRQCAQFAFDSGPREQLIKGEIRLDDGQWHHVAGVYDGHDMFLYVDGKLDVSKTVTAKIPTNDEPVFIGANSQRLNREWKGLLDDVRVYRRALSPDEIAVLSRSTPR